MRRNKLLACLLVSAMVVLSACNKGDKPAETTAAQPTTAANVETTAAVEPTTEPAPAASAASIDFEDGNAAFAITHVAAAVTDDAAVLSIADFNGSKALLAENLNPAKVKAKVAFDVESLLGDKLGDVASISVEIGTDHDGTFAAISGSIVTYTGENATETKNTYSVYLAKTNPKTIKVDLGDKRFVAGAKNYLEIAKEADAGATAGDLYIDNITFYDAAGNVIAADTTVELAEDFPIGGEVAVAETHGRVYSMDPTYAGDWGATPWINAAAFDGLEGPVQVTVKFLPLSGFDYYVISPMTTWWTKICGAEFGGCVEGGTATPTFKVQDDGFVAMTDSSATEFTVTLTAEAVEAIRTQENDEGLAALGFQTYGVTPYEVVISDDYLTSDLDPTYAGDWGATPWVSAKLFEGMEGPVQITVKFLPLSGFDYYVISPMTTWWTKICSADFGGCVEGGTATPTFKVQDDGFVAITDTSVTEFTVTLTPEAVEAILTQENDEGLAALGFQTYGITPYEVTITDSTVKASLDPTYAGDWGATPWIDAALLAGFDGPVQLTVNFLPLSGFDYYVISPMTSWWTKICGAEFGGCLETGVASSSYKVQDDGFVAIADSSLTSFTVTLTAEAVEAIRTQENDEGKALLGFQTYGVTPYEVIVTDASFKALMEPTYAGDWGATPWVNADLLAGVDGPVQLTVKFLPLSGFDYYVISPMTSWWTKFCGAEFGGCLEGGTATATFKVQDDGFVAITDSSATEFTITLTAEAVEAIRTQENDEGVAALGFQTYGITPYEIIITK